MSTPVAGQSTRAEAMLHRLVERSKAPGVQYVHVSEDAVLFRFHAGLTDVARGVAVTGATMFNGFSTTKTFTAVAVLQLAERGLVQLDATAATYLSDFPYPRDITVRNLLTHAAGIPNPLPLRWVHLAGAHGTFNRNAFLRAEYARHPAVKAAPNEQFRYSNHRTGMKNDRLLNNIDREWIRTARQARAPSSS